MADQPTKIHYEEQKLTGAEYSYREGETGITHVFLLLPMAYHPDTVTETFTDRGRQIKHMSRMVSPGVIHHLYTGFSGRTSYIIPIRSAADIPQRLN